MVKKDNREEVTIIAHSAVPPQMPAPRNFQEALLKWKQTWMWVNLLWVGTDNWIADAIRGDSCIAVTDGSYMKHLFLSIHAAALVLEYTKGRGDLWCSFSETSSTACSYRGELVGLMAIHLILLSVNEVRPNLKGSVHIYSDCLGALNKVKNLPPSRIPSSWAHSDILKNILVNCGVLLFARLYSHVRAHQDDKLGYQDLSRPSQLNCSMDFNAKRVLLDIQPMNLPSQ